MNKEENTVESDGNLMSEAWEGTGIGGEAQIVEEVQVDEMEKQEASAQASQTSVMTKMLTFKYKDLEADYQKWRFRKVKTMYYVILFILFLVLSFNAYNIYTAPNTWPEGVTEFSGFFQWQLQAFISLAAMLLVALAVRFVPSIYMRIQHWVHLIICTLYYFGNVKEINSMVLDQVVVGLISAPFFKFPPLYAFLTQIFMTGYSIVFLLVKKASITQILHRYLFSGFVAFIVIWSCYALEKTFRLDYFQQIKSDYSFSTLDAVLRGLLPNRAVNQLYSGQGNEARQVDEAVVVFATLKIQVDGEKHGLLDNARYYHSILEKFDNAIEEKGLYKVSSTVSGSFLAAAGLPEDVEDGSAKSLNVALEMLSIIEDTKKDISDGVEFAIQIGVHRGPVAGGVIGKSRPYYQIMGDTVNTSARLATTAMASQIQVAHSFFDGIPEDHEIRKKIRILDRGNVWMKGKGEIPTCVIVSSLMEGEVQIPPPIAEPVTTENMKQQDFKSKFVLSGKDDLEKLESKQMQIPMPNEIQSAPELDQNNLHSDLLEWKKSVSEAEKMRGSRSSAISIGSTTIADEMTPTFDLAEVRRGKVGLNVVEVSSMVSGMSDSLSEGDISVSTTKPSRSSFFSKFKKPGRRQNRPRLVKDERKAHRGMATFQQVDKADIYALSIWTLKFRNNEYMEKIYHRTADSYNRPTYYQTIKFILVFEVLLMIADIVWVSVWGSNIPLGQATKMTIVQMSRSTDEPTPGFLSLSWIGVLIALRMFAIFAAIGAWWFTRYLKIYLLYGQKARVFMMIPLIFGPLVCLIIPDHLMVAGMELFLNYGTISYLLTMSFLPSVGIVSFGAVLGVLTTYFFFVVNGFFSQDPNSIYWIIQPILVTSASAIIAIRTREVVWRRAMTARLKQRRLQRQAQMLLHDLIPKDIQGKWRDTVLNSLRASNAKRRTELLSKNKDSNIELGENEKRAMELDEKEKLFESFVPAPKNSLDSKTFIADLYPNVAVADIVSFTESSEKLGATNLCAFLTTIYSLFDRAAIVNEVYKVDIVGDAYVVMCGAPEPVTDAADRVINFGLNILEIAKGQYWPDTDKPIQLRVGAAFGPLVTGIFGSRRPRYQPFGTIVSEAETMEHDGIAGLVHITAKLREQLYQSYEAVNIDGKDTAEEFFIIDKQKSSQKMEDTIMWMDDEEEEDDLLDAETLQQRALEAREKQEMETQNASSIVAMRAIGRK